MPLHSFFQTTHYYKSNGEKIGVPIEIWDEYQEWLLIGDVLITAAPVADVGAAAHAFSKWGGAGALVKLQFEVALMDDVLRDEDAGVLEGGRWRRL